MIRPLTCLCLGAALVSGLYLYSEKHQAELLDKQIGAVMRKTDEARAQSRQLETEWEMLNEPSRLKDMAGKYLTQLKPTAPGQFVQVAALAEHLPAPEAPKPEGTTDEDAQAPVVATADTAAPEPVAPEPVAPEPDLPPPAQVAEKPPAKPATKLAAKADPKSHHVAVADRDPMPHGALAHGEMLPLASPRPLGARVMTAIARPMHQPRAAMVSNAPAYGAPAYIGSAIATGRSALPPPVPLGAGE